MDEADQREAGGPAASVCPAGPIAAQPSIRFAAILALVAIAASIKASQDGAATAQKAPVPVPKAEQPSSAPATSSTIGYWRFEGDGKTAPEEGAYLTDTADRTGVFSIRGVYAVDSSGNGNTLYTWNANFTGHRYTANVPAAIVPQTGEPNLRSIRNAGFFPATFTWSRESKPKRTDVETITPLSWTIEASINRTRSIETSTFVGREGQGVATGPVFVDGVKTNDPLAQSYAPLYFQCRPVSGNAHLAIQFTDMAGFTHRLLDPEPMSTNTWYHVAAVSDGTTLSLYKNSGSGYVRVNSTSLAATGSTDTRLCYDSQGADEPDDQQWGWTIGRGRNGFLRGQGDDHAERWMGYIDEVRISNAALAPAQFLFSPKTESEENRQRRQER
jgi:hypothetical protein